MSNNSGGDFDTEDFDLGEFDNSGFDDLNGQKTLSDVWKNNPVVKFVVIGGAFLLLVIGIVVFGKKDEQVPVSMVATNSDISELPGTSEVSPAYTEAIEDVNNRRIEEAVRTGASTMPLPTDPIKGTIPLQFEDPEEEDPLERWRRLQEERIRQQQAIVPEPPPQQTQVPEPVAIDTKTPAVNALAPAMSAQIETILDNQFIPVLNVVKVTDNQYLEDMQEAAEMELKAKLEEQNQLLATAAAGEAGEVEILLPAGTIEYAQLITEANTDAPGPILAQIASGPLQGARLIGGFAATEDYLTLSFSTIVIDGISFPTQAVAIDPNTTLPGLATDVDKRYFKRIMLPTAAAFVTGLTEAIAESGSTTVTINNETVTEESSDKSNDEEVASGIAEAGEEIETILDDIAEKTVPLIRVRAGTPMGILFTEAVTTGTDTQSQNQ